MWSSTVTLAFAAGILGANAINLLQPRDATAPRVVQHEIQRRNLQNVNLIKRDRERLRKRTTGTVSETLDNEETLYFMNITIGTPAQSLRMTLDTGSSDLWVNVANSTLCSASGDECAASGTYDANSSSTYEYLNSDFNITYVDGSGSSGDYVTDVVKFGSVTLKKQEFGIGYTSTSDEGVLGIGYEVNEVAYTYGSTYANVPQSLLNDGYINTVAYSLWLNDLDASTGSILFGGVNSDKYTGTLETLPIIPESGVYAEFIIALTGVGMNGTAGSIASDLASPALLDSGSSLMYLPDEICTEIYDAVGGEYDEQEGAAFIDCGLSGNNYTIDLTFSTPTISIAISELVFPLGTSNGEEVCILGIIPAGDSTPVLGDTFLRSAYVVYDLTNNEISLAQTKFNSTTDNILEITNSSSIPGASSVTNAVTSVAVESGGAVLAGGSYAATATGYATATSKGVAALVTSPPVYNGALVGAMGAGLMFLL